MIMMEITIYSFTHRHFFSLTHFMVDLHHKVTCFSKYHAGFITVGVVGPTVNQGVIRAV